jgi:VanZ family protein
MGLISYASGDALSASHSSKFFEPLMHWLFPNMGHVRIGDIHYLLRKSGHLTEFGVLGLLCWHAIRHSRRPGGRAWLWADAGFALALVALCAAVDETRQKWVPGRTGQFSDVVIDVVGAALGLGLLWLAGKIFKRW